MYPTMSQTVDSMMLSLLDWCTPGARRTPQAHPYSFDAHFLWRDFDKARQPEGVVVSHSDRMHSWDPEAYAAAMKDEGHIQGLSRAACRRIIERFHGGEYVCVGYAVACNASTGYPIGMFYSRPKTRRKS